MAAGITGTKPNVFDPHKKKQLASLSQWRAVSWHHHP